MDLFNIALVVIAAALGFIAAWLLLKGKVALAFERGKIESQSEVATLNERLRNEQRAAQEKLAILESAREKLSSEFALLSAKALQTNNDNFLKLAETKLEAYQEAAKGDLTARQQAIDQLVKPLKESLDKVDLKIQEIEKTRVSAYSGLTEQIKALNLSQLKLQQETGNLVRALRTPSVRGRWGEMQLRRVVELAGMVSYCDFYEQESLESESGRLRPDMLVRLPGGRTIVVDSKAPLQAYLDALEIVDESARSQKMQEHARQIRTHLVQLGAKSYWDNLELTPEFVVMFLPGEMFFSAALEQDPSLIEAGVAQRVIVSNPTTLIALLRAVAYGWRQEQVAKNAQEISEIGKALYERLSTLAGHFDDMRSGLEKAVGAYNSSVGTLEKRIFVTARRFKELGATSAEDIPVLETIDKTVRAIQVDELVKLPEQTEETKQIV